MRRAAKVDGNHSAIIDTLRAAGLSVHDASAVGQGFPDLVCGYGGRTFLVEVKDGAKFPSQRKLTKHQEAFRAAWKGHYMVLETVEAAKLWAIAVTKKL